MTDITIKRACEVLRAEGYNDAAQYLNTWAAMPSALRDVCPLHDATPERNQPAVAELAERLAKVEDRLARLAAPADNYGSILTRLDAIDGRLDTQSELRVRGNQTLDGRIDKVAEIIGERVSGLVEQLDKLEGPGGWLDNMQASINWLTEQVETLNPGVRAPAFPTGGASTAEAATDAVLPVPQRGDRVRLEGAKTINGHPLKDGWYDVLGHGKEFPEFQIGLDHMRTPWVRNDSPGLKEVTRNAST